MWVEAGLPLVHSPDRGAHLGTTAQRMADTRATLWEGPRQDLWKENMYFPEILARASGKN